MTAECVIGERMQLMQQKVEFVMTAMCYMLAKLVRENSVLAHRLNGNFDFSEICKWLLNFPVVASYTCNM